MSGINPYRDSALVIGATEQPTASGSAGYDPFAAAVRPIDLGTLIPNEYLGRSFSTRDLRERIVSKLRTIVADTTITDPNLRSGYVMGVEAAIQEIQTALKDS